MKKLFIVAFSLLCFLFLSSFVSMNKKENLQALSLKPYLERVSKENDLKRDILTLIEIREKIADRVIGNGISKSALLEAIQGKDDKKIRKIIGMSEGEYNTLESQFNEIKSIIYKKFPDVQKLVNLAATGCSSCAVSKKISFINSLPIVSRNNDVQITMNSLDKLYSNEKQFIENTSEQDGCRWVEYTACLVVCTALGPILYWPCAYLCWDTYCDFLNTQ